MRIEFLGTGTSMGIPMIGCGCEVCRSADPHDKRLRTSVWVRTAGKNIIIDTGIDFRQQALRAGISGVDAVLFTHHHADHIFGLDDLRPINILQKRPVPVYSTRQTAENLRRIYRYIFDEDSNYPSDIPRIRSHIISEQPFRIGGIEILPVPVWHGELPVLGFRIGNFAYCTDVSRIPAESYSRLANLDVLVLGALRYRPHPTHLTIEQAVSEAQKIKAKRTFLVHLSHEVSHRQLVQDLRPDIRPAFDGQVLELPGGNG